MRVAGNISNAQEQAGALAGPQPKSGKQAAHLHQTHQHYLHAAAGKIGPLQARGASAARIQPQVHDRPQTALHPEVPEITQQQQSHTQVIEK